MGFLLITLLAKRHSSFSDSADSVVERESLSRQSPVTCNGRRIPRGRALWLRLEGRRHLATRTGERNGFAYAASAGTYHRA